MNGSNRAKRRRLEDRYLYRGKLGLFLQSLGPLDHYIVANSEWGIKSARHRCRKGEKEAEEEGTRFDRWKKAKKAVQKRAL